MANYHRQRAIRAGLPAHSVSAMALAVALAVAPQDAQAQSFQGTPTVTAGAATINTGTTSTDIAVETTQVVIDWVPIDQGVGGGNIDFQPLGTSASFTNNVQFFVGDYAVLNRIVPVDPSRMVELNGTITSIIDQGSIFGPGGNIFFYSPGGILVGGSAIINVGSLVLTTNDPLVSNGQFIDANNVVQFQQASQPGAQVMTAAGSSIFTSGSPDFATPGYLALVAPVVRHAGSSFSNDAAAMVSADAATIRFSPDGLFDIMVTSGTSGVGTTLSVIGDLNTELGGRAYLAAVPKNDAITMALTAGSETGFDVAQNATAINASTVILGAGTDIIAGNTSLLASAGSGTGVVDVDIDGATVAGVTRIAGTGALNITGGSDFRGALIGQVNDTINILANTGDITIASTLALDVGEFASQAVDNSPDTAGDINVIASAGNTISINGPATLRSVGGAGLVTPGAVGKDGTGGDIIFHANGGTISVNGNLQLLSEGVGRMAAAGGISGTGTGGDVSMIADAGGNITATSTLLISRATSEDSSSSGDTTSGAILIDALSGGTVSSGTLRILSQAISGNALAAGGVAGDGTGGTVTLRAINGTIVETDNAQGSFIRAEGFGGDAFQDNAAAGDGTGGTVNIFASGNSGVISFLDLTAGVSAMGGGGDNGSGKTGFAANAQAGSGDGGMINVDISNGASLILSPIASTFFSVDGLGGISQGINGIGGRATGGSVVFTVSGGASADLGSDGTTNVLISADATGGAGGITGTGGNAIAGTSRVEIIDADLAFATLTASAIAQSGNGGTSGIALGGNAIFSVSENDPAPPGANAMGGILTIISDAFSGAALGAGGAGIALGGNSTLQISGANAQLMALGTDVSSEASGGATFIAASNSGDAMGGDAQILINGGTLDVAGFLEINISGLGGTGVTPGLGVGGLASLSLSNGATISADSYLLLAEGNGGHLTADLPDQAAGDGFGGAIDIDIINSTMLDTSGGAGDGNFFSVSGIGGDVLVSTPVSTGLAGGTGDAGSLQMLVSGPGALLDLFSLTGLADGIGGVVLDFANQSSGGFGNAGGLIFEINDGATVNLNGINDFTLSSTAKGGDSPGTTSDGGNATGGGASIFASGGSLNVAAGANLQLLSNAEGGDGGQAGGQARAGISQISIFDNGSGTGGALTADMVLIQSAAIGGNGQIGGGSIGGNASLTAGGTSQISTINIADVTVDATGQGGSGLDGIAVDGGVGGDGQGGFAGVQAVAGTGQITLGSAVLLADGIGGNGGTGGDASGAPGFDGGRGGDGFGGIALFGIGDAPANPAAAGFIDVDQLILSGDGLGGLGGDGGMGDSQGNGGNGGDGDSGGARLEAEGAPIIINQSAVISADGRGADGGMGTILGIGGDGFIGGDNARFVAEDDIRIITEIGAENGVPGAIMIDPNATLVATTQAVDGANSADAGGRKRGRAFFLSSEGVISGGTISLSADYAQADPLTLEEALYFGPGSATMLDSLSINSSGPISFANEGNVDVGAFILSAPDTVFSTLVPAPASFGNLVADGIGITNIQNLILQTNFETTFDGGVSLAGDQVFIGDVTAAADLFIQSNGMITTGQVDSGGVAFVQGAGPIAIESIAAPGPIFVSGGDSIAIAGNVATPGNLFIGGVGDISLFSAAAANIDLQSTQGAVTAGQLDALGSLTVSAAGAINITGDWLAGLDAQLTGGDLNIDSGNGLASDGPIVVISTNIDGVFLGSAADGASGGFEVTQAEFDALSSPDLRLLSTGGGPDASFMEIGDLTITFGDPLGLVGFGNLADQGNNGSPVGAGTLLISGNVVTSNAGVDNELAFAAQNLLINAQTGGIFSLDGAGNANGFVSIIAENMLAAENSILSQLAADPMLAGRADLINAPLATPRPDGIFVAGGVGLFGTSLVAIQNTGSLQIPAGFFVVNGFSEFDTPSVEFLINGQIADGLGGVITGDAVAEIVFTDPDIPLAAGSTVNGCTGVGLCPFRAEAPPQVPRPPFLTPITGTPPPLFPPDPIDPEDPGITDPEHEVLTGNLPLDPITGSGDDPADDGEDTQDGPGDSGGEGDDPQAGTGQGGSPAASGGAEGDDQASQAPIEAPAALVDFTSLEPDRDVFAPVSGGANPALIGAPKPSEEDEGEDEGEGEGETQDDTPGGDGQ